MQHICKSAWGSALPCSVMQTVCISAVARAGENYALTESFMSSMTAEEDGPYPREFHCLEVSFVIAELSRS